MTTQLPATGTTLNVLGESVTSKLSTEKTRGAYAFFEVVTPPGSGTPLHRHPQDSECFYVLKGRYAFQLDEETREAGPGEHVQIPFGAVHSYRNAGETTGRMLLIVTPGELHERFFAALSELPMPPEPARIMEVARQHQIEIFPPA